MGWASRRKSHSVINTAKGGKYRHNPQHGENSLTRRERDLLYRTELTDPESNVARSAGFDRNYGSTWPKGAVNSSTPMNRDTEGLIFNQNRCSYCAHENVPSLVTQHNATQRNEERLHEKPQK